jgi:hypothetical protein
VIVHQPLDRRRLQRAEARCVGDAPPECGKRLACRRPAAARQSVGEHHGVHRAGGGRADALEGEAFVLEKRSSTPQAKAPCAPPPWSARLIVFTAALLVASVPLGVGAVHVLPFLPPDCSRDQCAVQPPSTGSAVPVIEAPPGPHRNAVSAPSPRPWRSACWAAVPTGRRGSPGRGRCRAPWPDRRSGSHSAGHPGNAMDDCALRRRVDTVRADRF